MSMEHLDDDIQYHRYSSHHTAHSPTSTPFRPIPAADGSVAAGSPVSDGDEADAASLHSAGSSSCSRRLQLPTSLPDLDDSSMRHVLAYVDHYELDLAWSTLSDSFFLAGGLGYVILSGYDLWATEELFADGFAYSFFSVLSPVVYLLNAIIDVKWARSVKERRTVKKAMTDHWHDWRVMLDLDCADDEDEGPGHDIGKAEVDGRYQLHEPSAEGMDDGGAVVPPTVPSGLRRSPMPWYVRLRRHAAHRRNILAALAFGLAAALAVVAVCIEYIELDAAPRSSVALDAVSVHVYVVSAFLSVSGKRTRPWLHATCCLPSIPLWSSPEGLEDLGDLFFLVGSVVDAVLCDWTFGIDRPGWSLFSSLLWLLDAVLYLRSDFVMAANLKRKNVDGGVIC